ncbi:MAG: helix-turn-helix domain-containing protein [Luteolibacter sp.]|jgi:AraC family transcriptional regulator, transcriptional activator of pobA
MKELKPLLLREIEVELPGLKVRRLCLNKHLPDVDALDHHSHRFCQVLCYLSGGGTLRAGGVEYRVFPGAVAFVPAGVIHGFRESTGRRPLCLVIDFEMDEEYAFCCAHLNQSESTRLRRELSELGRLRRPGASEARLRAAASALRILDLQLRAVGVLEREARAVPAFVKKFIRLASDMDTTGNSIAHLAHETGYQADYLNRKFKEVTGLTLIQQRDALRLDRAKLLIRRGLAVGDVAERVGFDDANYFSRWFKRHTGAPPSHYAG